MEASDRGKTISDTVEEMLGGLLEGKHEPHVMAKEARDGR